MNETDKTKPIVYTQFNIKVPKKIKDEIRKISVIDDIHIEALVLEGLEYIIKTKGDGNPGFTLDQFQDQQMLAIPALMRKGDEIAEYLNHCPDHIVKEITDQINNVWIDKLNKLFQYGDAKMRVV